MATYALRLQALPLDGGKLVLVVEGDLDIESAPSLADALDDALESGRTHIVIDMSTTTFIDSTAIHVLVAGARELRQRFGQLALACADPGIRRMIEITGLDLAAPLFESREAALRGLLNH
jgi:anti-sigma B factor antagonist